MTELKDLPRDDLVAATAHTLVRTYRLGFETSGRFVLAKFVFEGGKIEPLVFCIPTPAILILANRVVQSSAKKGRLPTQPQNEPDFEPHEWDCAGRMVSLWRVDEFDEAVIIALQYGKDLVQCIRMESGLVLQLARDVLEQRQEGTLRDLRTEVPPSGHRH